MNFNDLIDTGSFPTAGKTNCVLTSRIRLARNLRQKPFPGWARREERVSIYKDLTVALAALPLRKKGFFQEMEGLDSQQKQVLVEHHLMSRELAARGEGCGLLVNKEKTISIMVNEEDHLRLQAIQSGLNLKKAYRSLDKVDTALSESLDFAYDRKLGFLTSCPSNVGTGMRASVMLHLPALTLSEQISPVLRAVSKLGLAIRGFYGEGTESLGNLYQISNQSTLGESEEEIIKRIERMVKQVITAEENAREKFLEDNASQLLDKVGRAYGVLKHAYALSSKEALNLLSLIRLGTEVSFFPSETVALCDRLMIKLQPAHLQLEAGMKLEADARDEFRAKIISSSLESVDPPNSITNNLKPSSSEDA